MNVLNLLVDTGMSAVEIELENLKIDKTFRDICESNQCGCYNSSYACPPAIGTLDECRNKIKEYDKGIFIQFIGKIEDSFDWEGMQTAKYTFEKKLRVVMDKLDKNNIQFLALGAGRCMLCKKCNYGMNKECRNKGKLIRSLEGFGIDVYALANFAKLPIKHVDNAVYVCGLVLIKNYN